MPAPCWMNSPGVKVIMGFLSRRTVAQYAFIILVFILSIIFLRTFVFRGLHGSAIQTVRHEFLYEPSILPITPRPDDKLCWDIEPMSWQEFKSGGYPFAKDDGRLAVGMAANDVSPKAKDIGFFTVAVPLQTPLKISYHMWLPKLPNTLNSSVSIRLLVLLNEKQLADAVQPSNVTLLPGDEVTPTLKIPALDQGIHDLVVLGVINPDKEPDPHGIASFFSSRFTLLAGEHPSLLPRTYIKQPAVGSITNGDPNIALELTLSAHELKVWNWPEVSLPVSAGHYLDFYILAGFLVSNNLDAVALSLPEQYPFALLAFLDENQTAIKPNLTVLYGLVARDTAYTVIPAQISVGTTVGRRNLLIVRIDYPGVPMCVLRGPYQEQSYVFNYSVFARRVALDVIR